MANKESPSPDKEHAQAHQKQGQRGSKASKAKANSKNVNPKVNAASDLSNIPSFYFRIAGDVHSLHIPIEQPQVVGRSQDEQTQKHLSLLQELLFERARDGGQLLIERCQFEALMQEKLQIKEEQSRDLLELAESLSIIQITTRNFSNIKTLHFISLKLEVMSLECLDWVLLSLSQDEMTPSERAIQSRVKEAFAFKLSNDVWREIMEVLQTKE